MLDIIDFKVERHRRRLQLARTFSKLVGHYERAGAQFVNRDGAVGVLFPVDAWSADKGA
jgi:hypothetical protein